MKLPLFIAIVSLLMQEADPLALFLLRQEDPTSYRGSRRMDGWWGDSHGWIQVNTWFESGKFSYQITHEGGSEQVRKRALKPSLEEESKLTPGSSAFNTRNYAFTSEPVIKGLTPLRILPKRKEKNLLDGFLFVRQNDGELVLVEGKSAKSPSFWVKNDRFTRYYQRINGARLPIFTVATARAIFKESMVVIHYQYDEVNGRPTTSTQPRN